MKGPRFDPRRSLAVLALAAFAGALAGARAEAPARTLTLRIAGHALKAEVVDTDPLREKGLMFREKLGRDEGMLFVFEEPAYQSMWMKNTLIALSVAFVDAHGTILNIRDMEPHSLETHMSAGPALYAIETNRGWFSQRAIKAGDRVTGLPRSPAR